MRTPRAAARALEDLVMDVATEADRALGELDREWWSRLEDTFRRIEVPAKGGPNRVRRAQAERDAAYLRRVSKRSRRGRRRPNTAAGTLKVVPAAVTHPAV